MPDLKIIDSHVHVAGPGNEMPGLYWHKRFGEGKGFVLLKIIKGWGLKKVTDRLMVNALLKHTRSSKKVHRMVILALDNVYDPEGNYQGPNGTGNENVKTSLFTSNHFVRDLCEQAGNSNLLFGLSVHPFRNDALAQLEAFQQNAVLCKWLPSSQMIEFDSENPEVERKLRLFYDKLAEVKLPLLLHVGREDSIPSAGGEEYQKYNHPKYIEDALERGVTVILAHCGCSYFDEPDRTDVIPDVIKLFEKMESENKPWKLYVDISAVYSPYRKESVLDEVFQNIDSKYLIYGSDWPNPSKGPKWWSNPLWIARYAHSNLIDRYYKICVRWLPEYYNPNEMNDIFTNFHKLLIEMGRGHLIG